MLKLMLVWSLLLALIIFGAKVLWPDTEETSVEKTEATAVESLQRDNDYRQLNKAMPECAKVMSGFLAASGAEERNQFVLNPVTNASRMVRFYSQNPIISIDPKSLTDGSQSLLDFPDGTLGIEARWSVKDGRTVDACFRKDNDAWLLDWEHFARYSDYPWPLFLAGSGPAEGEFRLLARERLATERKDSPTISLALYAPRFGKPAETGFQSPEVLVRRSTRSGKLLEAAFAMRADDERVFNSSLPTLDPDGLIRVYVKVRREDGEVQRQFEITEVIACHWMSVDDPGVEIEEEDTIDQDTQDL